MPKVPVQCAFGNTTITFTNNDPLLGYKPHNRSLFVIGYMEEQKVNLILKDGGLTTNIMPRTMMNNLGTTVEESSKSQTMIQGFNLEC